MSIKIQKYKICIQFYKALETPLPTVKKLWARKIDGLLNFQEILCVYFHKDFQTLSNSEFEVILPDKL